MITTTRTERTFCGQPQYSVSPSQTSSYRPPAALPAAPPTFVAIDFETADSGRDSACALALVRVEAGVIVQRAFHYIRPPRQRMIFTYLHGISWEQVANQT